MVALVSVLPELRDDRQDAGPLLREPRAGARGPRVCRLGPQRDALLPEPTLPQPQPAAPGRRLVAVVGVERVLGAMWGRLPLAAPRLQQPAPGQRRRRLPGLHDGLGGVQHASVPGGPALVVVVAVARGAGGGVQRRQPHRAPLPDSMPRAPRRRVPHQDGAAQRAEPDVRRCRGVPLRRRGGGGG